MRTTTTFDPRQRGVVMVIMLLALLLLVGLALWVLNLGQQVNNRQATQDAADATAIAGGGWVARTMNAVAQNNIGISRYIALVNVLDTLPMATEFAYIEQTAMLASLDDQLDRGVGTGPSSLMNEIEDMLQEFREELQEEVDHLEPVHEMFSGIDIRSMTYHNAPEGMGQLWKAMYALDEVNQTFTENLGRLAQINAVRGGSAAYRDDVPARTFMVPLSHTLPVERGQFNDFRRPVKHGILPQGTDDPLIRRGPYDTVFGWHERVGECVEGVARPPSSSGPGGSGTIPIGRSAGSTGRGWNCTRWEYTHYRTWGPQSWMLRRIWSFNRSELRNARFSGWCSSISNAKLEYLWPGGIDDQGNDEPLPDIIETSRTRRPEWVTDFNRAVSEAAADNVHETAFFAVEIKSRYPVDHPSFMTAGSWAEERRGGIWQPHIVRRRGWVDPRTWTAEPAVDQIVDYGWREQWTYRMYYDPEIGLEPQVDDLGQPVAQDVYRIDTFYFAGVNIGDEVDIGDPYQGFNKDSESAPAPIDLQHDLVTRSDEDRREYLTCLGIARHRDRPQAWATQFRGGKPYAYVVGISQIQIFNNHSWDLWTPMWHAQLQPVTDYEDWLTTFEAQLGEPLDVDGLDSESVELMYDYLSAARELAPVTLEH